MIFGRNHRKGKNGVDGEHGHSHLHPRQFAVESQLPAMRSILLALGALTLLACGIYPVLSGRFAFWNSGPISNSHKLIEKDCKKCHAEPFQRVQDAQCLNCHELSDHAAGIGEFSRQHGQLVHSCGDCHMEHNEDHGLLVKDAAFCVNCHGTLPKLQASSQLLAVSHFSNHPQFRVSVKNDSGVTERVSLDDRGKIVDQAQIKLNHAIHLKAGLRGPAGPITLTCQSCHQLDTDFKKIRPISFDSHCRDCHNLGFDERLPEVQVPHGNAEAVYPALFTEYSKLLLPGADRSVADEAVSRRFPQAIIPQQKLGLGGIAEVAQSARDAEKQLFTKTGCFLCHTYKQKEPSEQTPGGSLYEIVEPRIPAVWLPAARFSHGAHEEFSCESCHSDTRNSTETKDVLLPKIQLCRDCHQQGAGPGRVESGCGECHSYHVALGFPNEKKHSIAEYLRGLMR
jgi:hypothetical protein